MKFTVKMVNTAVLGEIIGNEELEVTGVEFDSRKIKAGDLFVPLQGEHDGHDYADKAIENGAVAVLWSKEATLAPTDAAVILVADTLKAFQALASYYLLEENPDVIAITGSNGKTTTKDMTAAVLSQKYQTYKTQGNYNNAIGLPYTVLHMPEGCEKLILEMGMNHSDEITVLSELAQPDVAAITIIGEAHIENLGSREAIADAKMEIINGLVEDGLLIIPAGEPLLTVRTENLSQKVETVGINQGDLTGKIISKTKNSTTFEVDGSEYMIPMPGAYNVQNALIALGIGRWYQLTDEEIARGLATVEITKNRTQWLKASNGADILSDVYNANPTAMGLVLETFGKLPTNGRRFAVLADMLELGTGSPNLHDSMVNFIQPSEYSIIYLYGPEMIYLKNSLQEKFPELPVYYYENDKLALVEQIKNDLQPTDSIVLKGSNGMGLIDVITALQS